jgi:hypothetical protein
MREKLNGSGRRIRLGTFDHAQTVVDGYCNGSQLTSTEAMVLNRTVSRQTSQTPLNSVANRRLAPTQGS